MDEDEGEPIRERSGPQGGRLTRAAILLAVLALGAAAAQSASAALPASYRAKLNATCTVYTGKFATVDAKRAQATTQRELDALVVQSLRLALKQAVDLRAVPMPVAARATMRPIFARFAVVSTHLRAALAAYRAKDPGRTIAESRRLDRLTPPLNRLLDAAGLRPCGSGQQ